MAAGGKRKKSKKVTKAKTAAAPKKARAPANRVAKRAVKKTFTVRASCKAKTETPNPMVQDSIPSGEAGAVSKQPLLAW